MPAVLTANQKNEHTSSIGVTIALASWALMFFTLLWGYVVFRLKAHIWFGPYLSAEAWHGALTNTVCMVVSSLALRLAMKSEQRRGMFFALAFGFGIVFLLGQTHLWLTLLERGFDWKVSIAGSFFYLLTIFHALHIMAGLLAMGYLWARYEAIKDQYAAKGIRFFWEFLLYVWLAMFVLIFIIQ